MTRMEEVVRNMQRARRELSGDRYRPTYHFLAPCNWMNDPNGAIFWQGHYHLFYQHNPYRACHGPMHWGHAYSQDLVQWRDLPVALTPTPFSAEGQRGCFSGGAVDHDGTATLIYYGCGGGVCIATSDDELLTAWQKCPQNPVIPTNPPGQADWQPFDPCAWREGDTWYALSGSGTQGQPGRAGNYLNLFRSADLVEWQYLRRFHVIMAGKEPESDIAVPDFFPLGDNKWMLLFASHRRGAQYYIGAYANQTFEPEIHGRMNYGDFGGESGTLCAPISLLDARGRRIMFGWITEGRTEQSQLDAGWAGVMTLPRVLSLLDHTTLGIEPVPELESLRRRHRRRASLRLESDTNVPLDDVKGSCLEIAAEFETGTAEEVGVRVCCSPEGDEQTVVRFRRADNALTLDVARSSESEDVPAVACGMETGPLVLESGETLKLRIFLDRSVIEAFANGRQCLTKRIYPSRNDSTGTAVFARGGAVTLKALDAWDMAPIWPVA